MLLKSLESAKCSAGRARERCYIPFTALSSPYILYGEVEKAPVLLYAKEFSFPSNNHDTQKGKMEGENKGNFPWDAFHTTSTVSWLFWPLNCPCDKIHLSLQYFIKRGEYIKSIVPLVFCVQIVGCFFVLAWCGEREWWMKKMCKMRWISSVPLLSHCRQCSSSATTSREDLGITFTNYIIICSHSASALFQGCFLSIQEWILAKKCLSVFTLLRDQISESVPTLLCRHTNFNYS